MTPAPDPQAMAAYEAWRKSDPELDFDPCDQAAFLAGYAARDAEVERLREVAQLALKYLDDNAEDFGWGAEVAKKIRSALAPSTREGADNGK